MGIANAMQCIRTARKGVPLSSRFGRVCGQDENRKHPLRRTAEAAFVCVWPLLCVRLRFIFCSRYLWDSTPPRLRHLCVRGPRAVFLSQYGIGTEKDTKARRKETEFEISCGIVCRDESLTQC